MKRTIISGLAPIALILVFVGRQTVAQSAPAESAKQAPIFQVDPSWLKLPSGLSMSNVSGVSVDTHDHVWFIYRPRVAVPKDKDVRLAPPVAEFDNDGRYIQGWGGPSDQYEWPANEHGIYVDDKDNVWLSGSSRMNAQVDASDDMLLKFTSKGKLLLQIGHRSQSSGAQDTANVHVATDLMVYRGELYVADGYDGPGPQGNHRVIVFDAETGAFKRMWGGFGNVPVGVAPPAPGKFPPGTPPLSVGNGPVIGTEGPGPQQLGTVHSIKVSNDGLVYVADRANRRVQVFTTAGKYVNQVFINRSGPSDLSACGIALSTDKDQRFLYIADYGNSHVVVLDRKNLEILYQFGKRSPNPGDFQGIHFLALDSKGNLYTAEVAPGNRPQRFLFKGLSTVPTH